MTHPNSTNKEQDKLLSEQELRDKINRINHAALDPLFDVLKIKVDAGDLFDALQVAYTQLFQSQKLAHTNAVVTDYVEFAQDVLDQFGYNGKSGGLSTLELTEQIVESAKKRGNKL